MRSGGLEGLLHARIILIKIERADKLGFHVHQHTARKNVPITFTNDLFEKFRPDGPRSWNAEDNCGEVSIFRPSTASLALGLNASALM